MSAKVLVAHGNTARLKRAVDDLQGAGFEVVATPDGGDAFARFFEEQPDFVLCSKKLPSLSGANFAKMVCSQSPTTPVIVLVEGDDKDEKIDGAILLPEPLDLSVMLSLVPHLAPEVMKELKGGEERLPSKIEVFTLAALKKFRRSNDLLNALDDEGLTRLAAMARHESRGEGECVIREGEIGDCCYFIVEGQVRVTLAEKNDAEVARISPGGFFGEMAILSDHKRSASVWTAGESLLLRFDRSEFLPFLERYPTIREVLSGVAHKRTEENLWRVLFDEGLVDKTFAEIEKNAPKLPKPPAPERDFVPNGSSSSQTSLLDRTTPDTLSRAVTAGAAAQPTAPQSRTSFGWGLLVGVVLGGLWGYAIGMPLQRAGVDDAPTAVARPAVAPLGDKPSAPVSMPPAAPALAKAVDTDSPSQGKAPPEVDTPAPTTAPGQESYGIDLTDRKAVRNAVFAASKAKDFTRASELGRVLFDRYRVDWEAHLTIAHAERRAGMARPSAELFEKFVELYPTNTYADDAAYFAARGWHKVGEIDKAVAMYKVVVTYTKSNHLASARKFLDALNAARANPP